MTSKMKPFHDVIPQLKRGVDFDVIPNPADPEGQSLIVFSTCPACGGRWSRTDRSIAILVMEHPAFHGEVSYAVHPACARKVTVGDRHTAASIAVLGAIAALNAEFQPEIAPPAVLVLDDNDTSRLMPAPGRPQ